jgi:hypothetical protein
MIPFRSPTLLSSLCSAALLLALAPGCAKWNLTEKMPWMKGETGEFRRPMRVVAMWSDTVLTTPGQTPVRGFGARLMFYALDKDEPIKVAGSLTVYAFDEEQRDPTDNRPDRKFVFTAEQFGKHYSKSDLGHSYSIWVPWDEVGGEPKEISLIVRFTPVEGGVVISEQVKQFLPGVQRPEPQRAYGGNPPPNWQTVNQVSPVQLVNYQATPEEAAERRMSTTTISIPRIHGGRPPAAVVRPRATRHSVEQAFGAPQAEWPASAPQPGGGLPPYARPGPASGPATAPPSYVAAQVAYPPAGSAMGPTGSAIPPGALGQPGAYSAAPAQQGPWRGGVRPPADQGWISRYARPRSRALGAPTAQLVRDHAAMRPYPSAQPYAPQAAPPATTPSGFAPGAAGLSQ